MEEVWLHQVVCHLVVSDWPVLWQLVSAPFLLTAIECRSCGYDVAVWVHSLLPVFSINWLWWNGNVSVVRSQVRRCVDIAANWLARLACGRSERYRSLDWARRWMDEGATSLFIINLSASVRAGGVPGGHYTWYSRAWVVNDAGSGGGGECLSRDRETQVRFVWGRDVRSVGAAVCPRTRYFASSAISQR